KVTACEEGRPRDMERAIRTPNKIKTSRKMIGPEGPMAHPYHSIGSEAQKFRPTQLRLRSAEMQASQNPLFGQFR
ncbi:MAG: hypothetical protein EBT35_03325, partial [Alphaproteobacteria bacterium]|nr:hypothetical protein [Alphaproteobacteria bacterium]